MARKGKETLLSSSAEQARDLFDTMDSHTVVSWNSLLHGYVRNGECETALDLFESMQKVCTPNPRTYVGVLSALAEIAAADSKQRSRCLEKGNAVYAQAVKKGCTDMVVENSALDLYGACGSMVHARAVFEQMPKRSIVSWNTYLQGYVNNEEYEVVVELFHSMREAGDGCTPNSRTYISALIACGNLSSSKLRLEKGKQMHREALRSNLCDIFVESSLIELYSKCGSTVDARLVFDSMVSCDTISWTVLIQGYLDNGEPELALEVVNRMDQQAASGAGSAPDARTYIVALNVYSSLALKESERRGVWLRRGRALHCEIIRRDWCFEQALYNTLAHTYACCGDLLAARRVFEEIVELDLVSCISAYVQCGDHSGVLKLIDEMEASGAEMTAATFTAGLEACGGLMAIHTGAKFHSEIHRLGLEEDPLLATGLVEFYSKLGRIQDARRVFDSSPMLDSWAWNSLMRGYAQQGEADRVFEIFRLMREQQIQPNELTFTYLLTACSHGGFSDRSKKIFEGMESEFDVKPNIVHFNCLVDVLARANRVEEAMEIARRMPCEANGRTWTSILSACQNFGGKLQLGKMAYEQWLKLDDKSGAAHVLLANMYGKS